MKAILWATHRWLGMLSCIGIVLWGLSGALHPVLSRVQPRAAAMQPPMRSIDTDAAAPLASLLQAAGVERVAALSLADVAGQAAWRSEPNRVPRRAISRPTLGASWMARIKCGPSRSRGTTPGGRTRPCAP